MGLRDPEEVEGVGEGGGEGFVRRVIGELCRGVGWLHRVGIVHRDIKLENILLTVNPFFLPPTSTFSVPLHLLPKPLMKITDFGLSRFINPSSPFLETRCGSESSAAPEIILGKPYDGRLTDAWAIGVVLYGLICGGLPFDSDSDHIGMGLGKGEEGGRGMMDGAKEKLERKRKMMRIARGQYSWKDGIGSRGVRRVVDGFVRRDPRERWVVDKIWEDEWMSGFGGVAPPGEAWGEESGDRGEGKGRRKVLDGYLLDEEVDAVARAEMEL